MTLTIRQLWQNTQHEAGVILRNLACENAQPCPRDLPSPLDACGSCYAARAAERIEQDAVAALKALDEAPEVEWIAGIRSLVIDDPAPPTENT